MTTAPKEEPKKELVRIHVPFINKEAKALDESLRSRVLDSLISRLVGIYGEVRYWNYISFTKVDGQDTLTETKCSILEVVVPNAHGEPILSALGMVSDQLSLSKIFVERAGQRFGSFV